MKKVIIILGTILLGIWMVGSIFTNESTGFAGQAKSVLEKSGTAINGISD